MSLIKCACDCLYQEDGYCNLERAAEITDCENSNGCLHFRPREMHTVGHTGTDVPATFTCQKENSGGDLPPERP